MIERDDELRRVLQQWEAPRPSAALDARISKDCKRTRSWKWMSIAAGFLLAAGIAAYWPPAKRIDTEVFRPLPNGAITVVKTGVTK